MSTVSFSFHSFLLIFLVLSCNFVKITQGNEGFEEAGLSKTSAEAYINENNMMGLEHCEDGNEECVRRRMIADAHLDYIYTQHHKEP